MLTHSAVKAARVPHGGLRVLMIVHGGGGGQVPVGQGHRVLQLIPGRLHGGAHLRADLHVFDHILGLAVRGLNEIRHSGSQSAVIRVVWK